MEFPSTTNLGHIEISLHAFWHTELVDSDLYLTGVRGKKSNKFLMLQLSRPSPVFGKMNDHGGSLPQGLEKYFT